MAEPVLERKRTFTESAETIFEKLGLNAENIVGTLFAGLGFWFSLKIVSKYHQNELLQGMRDIDKSTEFFAFIVFFGSIVFLIYKKILGELIIFPTQHYFHSLYDRFKGRATTSPVWIMRECGVAGTVYALRAAYDDTKNSWMALHGRPEVGLTHGELHIMYLTAFFFLGTALFIPHQIIFIGIGIIVLLASFFADTSQHIAEGKLFRRCKTEIVEFLTDKYYI